MRYAEIDLLNVYVAPIALMIVAAWLLILPIRHYAERFGLLRFVWHPALFMFAVYAILLSGIVLLAGRIAG